MTPTRARHGLVITSPGSGAGKTMLTLGLLRALRRRGSAIASAKSGPDYIDPAFHAAASGAPCVTLDPWAMVPARLRTLAAAQPGDLLIVEGAMGFFDGAADGTGSTADLAAALGLPAILMLNAARMAQSAAAVARGFAAHRADAPLAGVVLNRIGSPRHEAMIRRALAPLGLPVLGALPRDGAIEMHSRHLGLVQAGEHPDLEAFLERAADLITAHVDLGALVALAAPLRRSASVEAPPLPSPPGQRIALARDAAFAFAYPHLIEGWRAAGAEIAPFSPLADEAPDAAADAVHLPGGYPELHAGRLSNAARFRRGVRTAAARGAQIYGECGGYMALGDGLEDAQGARHAMLGLLRLETSFAKPRLHLGYRRLTPLGGPWAGALTAHEFHYATTLAKVGAPLFAARDAEGADLGTMGIREGSVCGSFAHVIDAG